MKLEIFFNMIERRSSMNWARLAWHRVRFGFRLFLISVFILSQTLLPVQGAGNSIPFYNIHNGERVIIEFLSDGTVSSSEQKKFNHFARDWRRNEVTQMNPLLLPLIWEVYKATGASQGVKLISGYRSPATNEKLKNMGRNVATKSQHTRGNALDVYFPGVNLSKMRVIGMQLQAGGVGYYPASSSNFVHLDVGSVRHWPRMNRKQLLAAFPNQDTVHIPSDGKPLARYSEAKRRLERGTLAEYSLANVRSLYGVDQGIALASSRDHQHQEDVPTLLSYASDSAVSSVAPKSLAMLPSLRPASIQEKAFDTVEVAVNLQPPPMLPQLREKDQQPVADLDNDIKQDNSAKPDTDQIGLASLKPLSLLKDIASEKGEDMEAVMLDDALMDEVVDNKPTVDDPNYEQTGEIWMDVASTGLVSEPISRNALGQMLQSGTMIGAQNGQELLSKPDPRQLIKSLGQVSQFEELARVSPRLKLEIYAEQFSANEKTSDMSLLAFLAPNHGAPPQ